MKGSTLADGARPREPEHTGTRRARGTDQGRAAHRLPHSCSCRERSTTRRSSSRTRARPSFRSAAQDTKRCSSRPGSIFAAATTGSFPTTATARCASSLGVTPLEMLLASVGAKDDPASGGRQMPSHWGHRRLNIPSQSSATGTQCLHAVGCAEAGVIYQRVTDDPRSRVAVPRRRGHLRLDRRRRDERRRVLGVAEHDVHEEAAGPLPRARTTATPSQSRWKCRRPAATSRASSSISRRFATFRCDGTDYLASYRTLRDAVAHVRSRKGPAFVHATVIRPYSHSLSDDEKLYKTPAEREAEARRDPLLRMRHFLKLQELATDDEFAGHLASVEREVNAGGRAGAAGAEARARNGLAVRVLPGRRSHRPRRLQPSRSSRASRTRWSAIINATLRDEMARDPRIVVFGEDVADASREEALASVAGKGGVFKVTHGLQRLLRQRSRLQLAAGRGEHHRPRRRHGAARPEAGSRDPVLRLHLAGASCRSATRWR